MSGPRRPRLRGHSRGRRTVLLLTIALLGPGTAVTAQQTCQGPRNVDWGARALRCVGPGAACAIYVDEDAGPAHRFSVEPTVTEATRPAGPLRKGDVLVAVDDRLITTRSAGRLLARVSPGQRISVLVRRGGDLVPLTFETRHGCGLTSLTVRASPDSPPVHRELGDHVPPAGGPRDL